ncbi:hypothetical protein H6F90_16705 [Trichocoleus sp. FACHB-591]|uniref:hypothetical protein n=1 Tax=Trichocoleus sp. FACHB-591 TaxID=2692872 RepID=UPI0016822C95|nr:hypothetical protein [Trichocoleus sp. FACHB-591]MBD2096745.1 hypothetical protein [Trichocoleus sp. FACHB-591]
MASPTEQTNYELWINGDGSYDFFPSTNQSARSLLDEGAKLINVIEAISWEEARQKQYEFLGWGSYKPAFDISEDVSILDSDGRKTAFNINDSFDRNIACRLTKISFKQLRTLEQEKIVLPLFNEKRNKVYTFPQLLQLQAYVLINQDRNVRVRNNVLKKVLKFYSNNFNKIRLHQSFPYSIGSTVKTVEPDLSDVNDLLNQVKQLDFSYRAAYTVHIYPTMMNVLIALHENAQSIYNIEFDEFKQMLVA